MANQGAGWATQALKSAAAAEAYDHLCRAESSKFFMAKQYATEP
jgi:hypothetical protein